eukprot:ANDGO_08377.mRNA.1 hypothetical protein
MARGNVKVEDYSRFLQDSDDEEDRDIRTMTEKAAACRSPVPLDLSSALDFQTKSVYGVSSDSADVFDDVVAMSSVSSPPCAAVPPKFLHIVSIASDSQCRDDEVVHCRPRLPPSDSFHPIADTVQNSGLTSPSGTVKWTSSSTGLLKIVNVEHSFSDWEESSHPPHSFSNRKRSTGRIAPTDNSTPHAHVFLLHGQNKHDRSAIPLVSLTMLKSTFPATSQFVQPAAPQPVPVFDSINSDTSRREDSSDIFLPLGIAPANAGIGVTKSRALTEPGVAHVARLFLPLDSDTADNDSQNGDDSERSSPLECCSHVLPIRIVNGVVQDDELGHCKLSSVGERFGTTVNSDFPAQQAHKQARHALADRDWGAEMAALFDSEEIFDDDPMRCFTAGHADSSRMQVHFEDAKAKLRASNAALATSLTSRYGELDRFKERIAQESAHSHEMLMQDDASTKLNATRAKQDMDNILMEVRNAIERAAEEVAGRDQMIAQSQQSIVLLQRESEDKMAAVERQFARDSGDQKAQLRMMEARYASAQSEIQWLHLQLQQAAADHVVTRGSVEGLNAQLNEASALFETSGAEKAILVAELDQADARMRRAMARQ